MPSWFGIMQHLSKESFVCNFVARHGSKVNYITCLLCLAGWIQISPWGICLSQHMLNLGNCCSRLFHILFTFNWLNMFLTRLLLFK